MLQVPQMVFLFFVTVHTKTNTFWSQESRISVITIQTALGNTFVFCLENLAYLIMSRAMLAAAMDQGLVHCGRSSVIHPPLSGTSCHRDFLTSGRIVYVKLVIFPNYIEGLAPRSYAIWFVFSLVS